jgi:uncharacterized protein (UPF0276 family)
MSDELNNMMVDMCTVSTSYDIIEKAVDKDLCQLVPYFINNLEPQLHSEYNEYYDVIDFEIDMFYEFLTKEYIHIVNMFIKNIKKESNCYINTNDVYTYIDYYIEAVSDGNIINNMLVCNEDKSNDMIY